MTDPIPPSGQGWPKSSQTQLVDRGITADRQRLKADMCTQFTQYQEALREAGDQRLRRRRQPGAHRPRRNRGRVRPQRDRQRPRHEPQGMIDYLTLFRSRKPGARNRPSASTASAS